MKKNIKKLQIVIKEKKYDWSGYIVMWGYFFGATFLSYTPFLTKPYASSESFVLWIVGFLIYALIFFGFVIAVQNDNVGIEYEEKIVFGELKNVNSNKPILILENEK